MVAKDFKNGGAVVDSRSVVLQPNQYIAWDQLATDAEGIRYELIFSPPQAGNGDQDGASPASQAGSAAGAGYAAAYVRIIPTFHRGFRSWLAKGAILKALRARGSEATLAAAIHSLQLRAPAALLAQIMSEPGLAGPSPRRRRPAAPPRAPTARFRAGHPGPNAYGLFGAPTPGAAAAGPPFPGAAPMTGPFSGSGLPFSTGAAPSWIDPFSNEAAAEACKQVNDKRKKSDKEKTSRIFVCDSSLKSQYLGDHTFKEGVDDGLSPSMYATKHFGPLLRKKIEKSKRNVVFGSTGLPASWDGMLKVGCAENSRGAKIVEGARGEELLELKAIEFFDENPPNPPGGLVRQCLDRDLGVKSYQNSKKINVIIFSNEAVAKALDESLNQECHPISLDFGEPKKPVVQHTLFIQIKGTTLIHTVHLQDLQKTEPGRPLLDLLNKEIKTFLQGLSDEADPESQVQILSISKPELLPVEIRNCLLSGEQIEALRKKYRSKLKRKKQNDDEATAEEVVELDGSEDEREQETESTCSASSPAPVPRLRPAAVVPPTLASTRARRGNAGMRKGDDSP
eukprot:tig00021491_g21767.t1